MTPGPPTRATNKATLTNDFVTETTYRITWAYETGGNLIGEQPIKLQ
jgi:hypothetical protein